MRAKTSAGLLMFRRGGETVELLLVHPGGPFFKNKDEGAWTIPKGEPSNDDEDLLQRAIIEFEEEVGIRPQGDWISLGEVRQRGGKTVHAWGFKGDLEPGFEVASNTFELEWPPRSGRFQQFPEVDKASFFPLGEARLKVNAAQRAFLDRLAEHLGIARGAV